MPAGRYDITIEQGASWSLTVAWLQPDGVTPVDWSGWSARMQIRQAASETRPLIEINNGLAGGVTPSGGSSTLPITLAMTDEQTAGLPPVIGVYDLLLESPGDQAVRLLEGKAAISPAVTR